MFYLFLLMNACLQRDYIYREWVAASSKTIARIKSLGSPALVTRDKSNFSFNKLMNRKWPLLASKHLDTQATLP
jgi:hypothetical protein